MDSKGHHPGSCQRVLHRLAIEEACREGYRFYDMGDASPDSRLARFKEKLGRSPPSPTFCALSASRCMPHDNARRSVVKKTFGLGDLWGTHLPE